MNMQTMAKALAVLTTYFPNLELTKDKIAIWNSALQDLTEEELVKGIKIFCLKHPEIYPGTNVIAHIRKYAEYDPNVLSAEEAWGEVITALRRNDPFFSNFLVSKAVETIGWRNLSESNNPEMDRAHFFRIYDALLKRQEMSELCGKIS